MNETQKPLTALLLVLAIHLTFFTQVEADSLSHLTRTVIPSNTSAAVSDFNLLRHVSLAQLDESFSPTIARVHSVEPLIIEILDLQTRTGEPVYNPHPFIEHLAHSADELKGIQSGDVITADLIYFFSEDGGASIRNIKKLGRSAVAGYARKGVLLYYAPVLNSPNSYLTIYRDGTVLSHDTPGNEIPNKHLTGAELNGLKDEYFAARINRLPSDAGVGDYGPGLFLSIESYQSLDVKSPVGRLQTFMARLDSMIAAYIESATFHLRYISRVAIKDWQYAETLPLDVAADENVYPYVVQNFERLARLKPSPEFFKEAEDYGRGRGDFYRYKGKLYSFTFPTCTDNRPTGSWACFRAAELSHDRLRDNYWGYIEWPVEMGLRLSAIPGQGVDIPKAEYYKHRGFYTLLLSGSRFMYQEGDYLFQGVQVTYH